MTDQQDDIVQRLLRWTDRDGETTPLGKMAAAEIGRLTEEVAAQKGVVEDVAAENEKLHAEIERLQTALGQIAGKNDLSGVADDMVETAARNALYECELIARDALDGTEQETAK